VVERLDLRTRAGEADAVRERDGGARPPQLDARERLVLWGGIGAITALAWLYLVWMPMPSHDASMVEMGMAMATAHPWTLHDAALMFAMWAVMMVAMMLPSASPMITMYARMAKGNPYARAWYVWLFAAGYLAAWTAFGAGATAAQYYLQSLAVLSDAMRVTPLLGGAILAAAGVYQFTSLKNICLAHCRSPLAFFMMEWRDGPFGAFRMGARHGAFCTGCCWMLMALLFVAGVMNLAWVAAIAAFVLLEKVAPGGRIVPSIAGVALIAAGVAVVLMRP
jgi:predicted metal-binding membrane protein